MDGDTGSGTFALPLELDTYVQKSIAHLLEPCACRQHLDSKLSESEDHRRQLQLQVHELHSRLEEADCKCAKAKQEACLNAQALKRQIADWQKLADHCKAVTQECALLTQECARLESECNLYYNDREVFMQAADEAEERAAAAQERAAAAETRIQELITELESHEHYETPRDSFEKPKTCDGEDAVALQLKLTQMEEDMQSMQKELENVKAGAKAEVDAAYRQLDEHSSKMHALLTSANQRYEESLAELRTVQEAYTRIEATHRDEQTVHLMVMSAINYGVCKALEDEKRKTIESLKLRFQAVVKRLKGEMRADRERMKVAEKGMKALLVEAQSLRQEMAVCTNNLNKAENEVQLLADENKELWLLLRGRHPSCSSSPTESPLYTKANKGMTRSKSQGKLQDKCEPRGQDSIAATAARRPLTPLRSNSPECRLRHR
ncbi:unnamed protein product [Sphagnum balticum]